MTEHIRSYTNKLFICVICVFIALLCCIEKVYAINLTYTYNGKSYTYNGKYDTSPSRHKGQLNKAWDLSVYKGKTAEAEAIYEATTKACYQEFRSWGMTPEGAAAVCGNIRHEGGEPSTFGATGVNTNQALDDDFNNFSYGISGFGLIGFTWFETQHGVFDHAAKDGLLWCNLQPQLEYLHDEHCGPNSGATKLYKENSGSAYDLAIYFMDNYEKPGFRNGSTRGNTATQIYNKYKDLPPKKYNGKSDSSSSSEEDQENVVSSSEGSQSVIAEADLIGMPKESGLLAKAVKFELPTINNITEGQELYNMSTIKQSLEYNKEFKNYDIARVAIVFAGLCFICYSMLLFVSMIFDYNNNWLDVSLVNVFTLGKVNYDPNFSGCYSNGAVGTKRMIVICLVVLGVGLLLVSGGLLPAFMKLVYNLVSFIRG